MMKITICACGYSIDNGKPTQRGACAARLCYFDDYDRKAIRVLSEPVGNSTGPQCDLKSAILGLMSIKATPVLRLRKAQIELITTKYVAQFMERVDGEFKLIPKKNIELIRRFREKAALFDSLIVQVGTKEQLQQAFDIAKTTVETGIGSDSDTITTQI
jgi:hypothetical protein